MSSADDIANEIKSWKVMLDSRSKSSATAGDKLVQKLVVNMSAKVSNLSFLDPNGYKLISEAVQAQGLTDENISMLTTALDAKFEKQLDEASNAKPTTKRMLFMHPLSYRTDRFLKKIRRKGTFESKITLCADYLANQMGCTHPHEKTYRAWLTLLILEHFEVWPKYQVVHNYLLTFKNDVVDVRKPWPFAKIPEYPKVPSELDPAVFKHMYPGDDLPTVVVHDQFHATCKHAPLRKNSKLLTQEKALEKASASSARHEEPVATCTIKKPIVKRELTEDEDAENTPSWARKFLKVAQAPVKAEPVEEIPAWAQKLFGTGTATAVNATQEPEEADVPAWAQNLLRKRGNTEESLNTIGECMPGARQFRPKTTLCAAEKEPPVIKTEDGDEPSDPKDDKLFATEVGKARFFSSLVAYACASNEIAIML